MWIVAENAHYYVKQLTIVNAWAYYLKAKEASNKKESVITWVGPAWLLIALVYIS